MSNYYTVHNKKLIFPLICLILLLLWDNELDFWEEFFYLIECRSDYDELLYKTQETMPIFHRFCGLTWIPWKAKKYVQHQWQEFNVFIKFNKHENKSSVQKPNWSTFNYSTLVQS